MIPAVMDTGGKMRLLIVIPQDVAAAKAAKPAAAVANVTAFILSSTVCANAEQSGSFVLWASTTKLINKNMRVFG